MSDGLVGDDAPRLPDDETIERAADILGLGHNWDTDLPDEWVAEVIEVTGLNPTGHFVRELLDPTLCTSRPRPISPEGMAIAWLAGPDLVGRRYFGP